jgi:hypothetical protein
MAGMGTAHSRRIRRPTALPRLDGSTTRNHVKTLLAICREQETDLVGMLRHE